MIDGQTKDFDLGFVRQNFPAFEEPSLDGVRFFENAGGSYACAQVVDRLTRFYRETKVQPYGPGGASMAAGELMDAAYERFARALGVDPDEIVFGPSTTQNVYVLAQAFGETTKAGDAIIVSNQDHEANIGAWRRLEETQGVEVREWTADSETGLLDLAALDRLLDDQVRLVAVTQCSNIVGAPNPIPEIAERVHAAGALLVADGVSYAPHGLPDVPALGADVYMFSLYKVYGPHQGVMVVRPGAMAALPNQSHWFNDASPRKRLAPAGPDHAQIAAANGVIDYLLALHDHHFERGYGADETRVIERMQRIHALIRTRETELLAPLLAFLKDRDDVRVLGPTDPEQRAPTVALAPRRGAADVARALASRGIHAGASDFYAPRIISHLGCDPEAGVLRLSFVHYTSAEDVAALCEALDAAL